MKAEKMFKTNKSADQDSDEDKLKDRTAENGMRPSIAGCLHKNHRIKNLLTASMPHTLTTSLPHFGLVFTQHNPHLNA